MRTTKTSLRKHAAVPARLAVENLEGRLSLTTTTSLLGLQTTTLDHPLFDGALPPTLPDAGITYTGSDAVIMPALDPILPSNSAWSGIALNGPTQLQAIAATTQNAVALTWLAPGGSVRTMLLERSSDGTNFTAVAEMPTTSSSFTDTSVTEGTSYTYRMRLLDSSVATTAAEVTTRVLNAGNLSAAAQANGSVALSWTDPSSVNTGYYVERSTDAQTYARIASLDGAATSYVDGSAVSGTTYFYRLVSATVDGTLTPTSSVQVRTAATQQPATSIITDVAGVRLDANGAVTITRNGQVLMDRQAMWGVTTGASSFAGSNLVLSNVDTATNTLTFTGAGCTLVVRHSIDPAHPNRVVLDATFTNNSGITTPGFSLAHNLMYFPGVAINTTMRSTGGVNGVGYAQYIWSGGSAALVNENQAQPISFSTASANAGLPNAIFWGLVYQDPVAAGQSVSTRMTLRFGESMATGAATEAINNYTAAHQYLVNWPDRRPIVPAFERWSGDTSSMANPPLPNINYLLSQIKGMNAQGFILWDLLGNINGDYGGDLRWLPQSNPTAAAQVDAWMSAARAAGITPGLALRWGIPQMHVDDQGRFAPWYSDTTTGSSFADCAAFLIDQARYARDRWGAKIFYVDCADPANADVWRTIQAALPDCLFLPENVSLGMYGATAPYRESRLASGNNFENFAVELPAARQIWSQAFGVLKVDDETPDRLAQFRPQIVQMVKSGVVLLGRDVTWISGVYADARA